MPGATVGRVALKVYASAAALRLTEVAARIRNNSVAHVLRLRREDLAGVERVEVGGAGVGVARCEFRLR